MANHPLHRYGTTDLIHDHATLRASGTEHVLIDTYGCLYNEICASNLLKTDIDRQSITMTAAGAGLRLLAEAIHEKSAHLHGPTIRRAFCKLHEPVMAGRPLLFMPYAGAFREFGKRPLVAWSDTRESVRALYDAQPWMERAESARILRSLANDQHADLVAMSGYSHSHAIEFVRGGVTRTVLQSVTVLVLMSH